MTDLRQNALLNKTDTLLPEGPANRDATRRHYLMVATATRTNTPEAPNGNA